MSASSSSRVVGVDVARCVALLGMMAVHVVPGLDPVTGQESLAHQVAGGRASALFAVLAGVSVALTSGRRQPLTGRPLAGAAAALAVRAGLVVVVGLGLGELDSGVAVILVYYGLFFLLALPFLTLRAGALLALAVPWLLLAPVVSHLLRPGLPSSGFDNPTFGTLLADPVGLFWTLLLTGYYPALPWLGYVLLGMGLGRCDLRARVLPLALALTGLGAAVMASAASQLVLAQPAARELLALRFGPLESAAGRVATGFYGTTPPGSWWWLGVDAPHSGTPFDLVGTAGTACLVLALALVVGRLAPRVAAVVFGAGAMTLTLYSAHVVLRASLLDGPGTETYLQHVGLALGVGAVTALLGRRGPLEAVVAVASRGARRAVVGTPRADAPAP